MGGEALTFATYPYGPACLNALIGAYPHGMHLDTHLLNGCCFARRTVGPPCTMLHVTVT